jgi:hypothetical protein
MAIMVGGLAAVTAGWYGGRAIFIAPFERQQERITALRTEVNQLDTTRNGLRDAKKDWSAIVERTLDMNPDRAHARFRGDVSSLLEKHRFTEGELVVRQLSPRKNKDLTVELPLIVTTKGKLKNVMAFLVDLLRRDYIVRIDSLALNAEQAAASKTTTAARGRPGAPAAGDPDGPTLAMALTVTTLVVPKIEGITAKPMEEITSSEKGRLPRDPSEYQRVAAVNIFSDYVPPPAPPPPKAGDEGPRVATGGDDGRPPPPPPPPPPPVNVRPDADHLTLVGTVSFNGQPVAWVRDDRNPADPPQRKTLNDPLDDGVLVLVHPRGIVVHATRGEHAGREFFYPYSKTFRERIPIEEAPHPDIVSALNVALGRQQ